jgi:hypothetical protein
VMNEQLQEKRKEGHEAALAAEIEKMFADEIVTRHTLKAPPSQQGDAWAWLTRIALALLALQPEEAPPQYTVEQLNDALRRIALEPERETEILASLLQGPVKCWPQTGLMRLARVTRTERRKDRFFRALDRRMLRYVTLENFSPRRWWLDLLAFEWVRDKIGLRAFLEDLADLWRVIGLNAVLHSIVLRRIAKGENNDFISIMEHLQKKDVIPADKDLKPGEFEKYQSRLRSKCSRDVKKALAAAYGDNLIPSGAKSPPEEVK